MNPVQAQPSPLDGPLPSTTLGQSSPSAAAAAAATAAKDAEKKDDAPAAPVVALRLPSDWAEHTKAEPWLAAAIYTHSGWEREPGRLVTEAEYEAARVAVLGLEIS